MKRIIHILKRRFIRSFDNEIDAETLKRMLKNIQKIFLIDVRTNDEYQSKHIDRAINIPLQDIEGKIEKIVLNKNDVIVAYCEYGNRSQKACIKLKKLGYKNVYNLENGINGFF